MSWEQLANILAEAREEADEERRRRPEACPNDGEPLVEDKHGRLRCPFDGWKEGDST